MCTSRGPNSCDPDAQHSERDFLRVGNTWTPTPIVMAEINYDLLDLNPASIRLVPVLACHSTSDVRWVQPGFVDGIQFDVIAHAGINGTQPSATGCSPPLVPAMSSPMRFALIGIVIAIGIVATIVAESRRGSRSTP